MRHGVYGTKNCQVMTIITNVKPRFSFIRTSYQMTGFRTIYLVDICMNMAENLNSTIFIRQSVKYILQYMCNGTEIYPKTQQTREVGSVLDLGSTLTL